ncbi:hypothetical protein [Mycobacterium sp. AZCC_0083]|nr:hypothetical protein [Mycobacterium sp. AZCC_0083]MBB5167095.1 hypothetical protein [Mycobacterium sp. AZCC_0083]
MENLDPYDYDEPLETGSALVGAFWGCFASAPIWIAMIVWVVNR